VGLNWRAAVASTLRLLGGGTPTNGAYPTVAIDGRGGSGKSTFARRLSRAVPEFALISGDDYFEAIVDPVVWGAFNDDRFEDDVLRGLRMGRSALAIRPYVFADRSVRGTRAVDVSSGVIVDRCFSFEMNVSWDVRIWVETSRDECLRRGVARDEAVHGARAGRAWSEIWQPREDEYIQRADPHLVADIVVDGSIP
jgi:uridine kinase